MALIDDVQIVKNATAYYGQAELLDKQQGLPVRNYLIEYFQWNEEQLGTASKPYQIDVDFHSEPCLSLHPKIQKKTNKGLVNTPIKDLLKPGTKILFDIEGIKLAKLRFFFLYGLKALDQMSWQGFILEGVNRAKITHQNSNMTSYHETFDRWWHITEVKPVTFVVQSFLMQISMEFPYLVLTSADYVRLALPDPNTEKYAEYLGALFRLQNSDEQDFTLAALDVLNQMRSRD